MPPSSVSASSSKHRQINKVAVLGAGTMGSRIAAHMTNAGLPVVLLDIVPPGTDASAQKVGAQQDRAGGAGWSEEIAACGVLFAGECAADYGWEL